MTTNCLTVQSLSSHVRKHCSLFSERTEEQCSVSHKEEKREQVRSPGLRVLSRSYLCVYTPAQRLWWTEFQPWLSSYSDAPWRTQQMLSEDREDQVRPLTIERRWGGTRPFLIKPLPRLEFIVVNSISVSEDKEIVLLITLAGFVLHVPVVLPCDLVIIPEVTKTKQVITPLYRIWNKNSAWRRSFSKIFTDLQAYNPPPHHSLSCVCEVFLR